jgi:hypothetical protein
MSKAKMGATVQYCGHNGGFIADIYRVGNVNVVRANSAVTAGNLLRDNPKDHEVFVATHHLMDNEAGFWRPDLGVFVVPEGQVKELKSKCPRPSKS